MRAPVSDALAITPAIVLGLTIWGGSAAGQIPTIPEPLDFKRTTPDFQRHVVPLFGRLGCNGRACHGSFQGQGGFRLSLFGYDFQADHEALSARIDPEEPDQSLILYKPTHPDDHEGGKRLDQPSWQYQLLLRWIESGASVGPLEELTRLEILPSEIHFERPGQQESLKVIAYWPDGAIEDVTALCRFKSNDPQVVAADDQGRLIAARPGDTHVVVFYDRAVSTVPVLMPKTRPSLAEESSLGFETTVDRLVNDKLAKLRITPSELADDSTFLRRVYLDVTGTLPTPMEIEKFLGDNAVDKRTRKIDELLESPAYAAWWTTFFCDLTGNNSRQLRNASVRRNQPSDDWYRWIYQRISSNMAYDEMVRGIVLATSRKSDESYAQYCSRMSQMLRDSPGGPGSRSAPQDESMPYYWMRQDVRDAQSRAINFAHAFLGIRIQCAQCHKHPFDQWTQDDFKQFSRFFSGVSLAQGPSTRSDRRDLNEIMEALGIKRPLRNNNELRRKLPQLLAQGKTVPFPQLIVHEPRATRNRENRQRGARTYEQARLLGGPTVDLGQYADVREPLMDWLSDESNPYFAKALVNRVWARYFGIGIIEPPDDLNRANAPSNGPLLDYLTESFIRSGYDLKWLHREITGSLTYQRSWTPNRSNSDDRKNFSRALPRRLPAEVAFDALNQSTANTQQNSRYLFDLTRRAIAIPGTFLPQSRRDQTSPSFALNAFGRSTRNNACDCDRSNETSLSQTVYFQNDRDIHFMMNRADGWLNEVGGGIASDLNEAEQARLNRFQRQITALETRIRRFEQSTNPDQQSRVKALVRNRDNLVRRIEPLKRRAQQPSLTDEEQDLEGLISQAYLRTLSRHPTQLEVQTCLEFIEASENPGQGLQGILWSLLNTREFIVNH